MKRLYLAEIEERHAPSVPNKVAWRLVEARSVAEAEDKVRNVYDDIEAPIVLALTIHKMIK